MKVCFALGLFALSLGAALPGVLRAADDDASTCRALGNDAERLACYDHAFGPPAAPGEQQTTGSPSAPAAPPILSRLGTRWELAADEKNGTFRIQPYKPVYILAAFTSSDPNTLPSSPSPGNSQLIPLNLRSTETKFQLSLKSKLWENIIGDFSDLWFGYTQSSRWQVFNSAASRPFRESDYEPEIMLAFRTDYSLFGWHGRLASIGLHHQSNGRAEPLSRNWNRVMGQVGLERGPWTVTVHPWWRIEEPRSGDDNPDIADYIGRADVLVTHNVGGHEISALVRHSLRGGDRSHGALELDWAFPIRGRLKGYVQVFRGYGESLIDYNHLSTYVGVGVSLLEWYSLDSDQAGR